MVRQTREALDTSSQTPADRGGSIFGPAWYAEFSVWPLSGPLESEPPELGLYPHPSHLELSQITPYRDLYGIEIALQAGGIHATYDAAKRFGTPDPSAPGSKITVLDFGIAGNYWHTKRFKLGVNFNAYFTPNSGSSDNLAIVPGNLGPPGDTEPDAHTFYELAGRATLMF